MNSNFSVFTNSSLNNTDDYVDKNATSDYRNEELAKIELAVLSTIFTLAVFGNSFVLITLLSRWKKLSRMQVFIIHLSVADMFVAFCHVLPQLLWDFTYRFRGNNGSCKSVKLVQVVAIYASSYVLVLTAIDRYNAICRPLSTHLWTTKRVHAMVIVVWILSIIFSLPQVFVFSYKEVETGSGIYDCWATFDPEWLLQLYVTWFTTSVFFVPVTFLVVTYGFVCYHVWIRSRSVQTISSCNASPMPSPRVKHTTNPCNKRISANGNLIQTTYFLTADSGYKLNMKKKTGLSNSKIRTFKLTFTVILCFIICWAPFFIVQMWSAFDSKAPFTGPVMTICMLLASLNSCTNPWIYLAFSKNFCFKLKREFSSRRARFSTAGKSSITTTMR